MYNVTFIYFVFLSFFKSNQIKQIFTRSLYYILICISEAFKTILCSGIAKLGIEADVKVYLKDGMEIDEDETLLACDNGTVFVFMPDGEEWKTHSSSGSRVPLSGEQSALKQNVMADSKGEFSLSFVVQNNYVY